MVKFDQMWTLVCGQMEQARQAVLEMDRAAAQQIIVRERRVDAFELKIDSDVEDFIALYTPVAVDLRFALAMLKINNDLERIGDYADGIARFVRDSDAAGLDPGLVGNLQLETMFDTVLGMLKGLQEALRTEDAAKATAIVEKDDLLVAIAYWVVILYILLLLTTIGLTVWVFHRSMRPLYELLHWLDRYTPGRRTEPVPDNTSVSEFRRLNAAAQRAVDRSEKLFERQKQFIGNASHELQTPLAVVASRIEWLIDNTSISEQQALELL